MPDPSKETVQDMLRRAAAGDETAWRVMVETYAPRVFGLIRANCGNADLAEEITQSTFCTIVAKLGDYAELGRFEPWLFRIAMNRLRDEMRRRQRQANPTEHEQLIAQAGAGPAGQGAGRHDELEASEVDPSEVGTALRQALGRLSDADQRIIHLRHNAGLSFKQIAEVLDQPLGTVLARHHRALRKLRDLLGPDPPPHEPPTQ
jgi:RNA polymerase sigma-70 factor (ECF subfamily)